MQKKRILIALNPHHTEFKSNIQLVNCLFLLFACWTQKKKRTWDKIPNTHLKPKTTRRGHLPISQVLGSLKIATRRCRSVTYGFSETLLSLILVDFPYTNAVKVPKWQFWKKQPQWKDLPARKIIANKVDDDLPDNSIQTNKYTLLTFFPKNLMEQFSKMANVYFLVQKPPKPKLTLFFFHSDA